MRSIFPEVGSISPGWYYGFSNYEDSFRPDWWDKHCGAFIRQMHHKDEQGILLLEDIGDKVILKNFIVYIKFYVILEETSWKTKNVHAGQNSTFK